MPNDSSMLRARVVALLSSEEVTPFEVQVFLTIERNLDPPGSNPSEQGRAYDKVFDLLASRYPSDYPETARKQLPSTQGPS